MLSHVAKFGIYLNTNTSKVVRITSPYWFPPEPDHPVLWMSVTNPQELYTHGYIPEYGKITHLQL